MSIDDRTKGYGIIWTDWIIGDLIGHGSGGKTAVYNLTRVNSGFIEEDVLKIINLVEENVPIEEMSEDFRRDYEEKKQEAIDKASEEVKLMHRLRNCMNIVSYQDFKVHTTNASNSTHTDLLIRMHKYSELGTILKKRSLSEKEIINVGIDICEALEDCQNEGIIHRDIKPGNIFYDGRHYLLGDFGISKILENGDLAQTCKGTPQYAAPEQFNGLISNTGYDYRVDIYSLGLTMYYIANKCKLPFVEQGRSISEANLMRLENTPIPSVKGISEGLNRVIQKACNFSPEERYQSASDMKNALIKLDMKSFNKTVSEIKAEVNLDSMETEMALGYNNMGISMETEAAIGISEVKKVLQETVSNTTEMKKVASIVTETISHEEQVVESIEVVKEAETEQSVEDLIHVITECVRNGDITKGGEAIDTLAKSSDMKFLYYEVNNKYNSEIFIRQDSSKVIFWYEKCINLCKDSWTVSLAEYQLGDIYLNGIGVKKNVKLAEQLFSSSAAKGNPYAMKKFVAGKFVK